MKKEYIRISKDFSSIKTRVEKGELKWSHYAVDEEVGYHYYEILK